MLAGRETDSQLREALRARLSVLPWLSAVADRPVHSGPLYDAMTTGLFVVATALLAEICAMPMAAAPSSLSPDGEPEVRQPAWPR